MKKAGRSSQHSLLASISTFLTNMVRLSQIYDFDVPENLTAIASSIMQLACSFKKHQKQTARASHSIDVYKDQKKYLSMEELAALQQISQDEAQRLWDLLKIRMLNEAARDDEGLKKEVLAFHTQLLVALVLAMQGQRAEVLAYLSTSEVKRNERNTYKYVVAVVTLFVCLFVCLFNFFSSFVCCLFVCFCCCWCCCCCCCCWF
jgi:hypothetical protein